jgi:hypothetical protein
LLFLAALAPAEIVDRIVATVGTQVVTLSDVQQEYRTERFLDRQPLESLDVQHIRVVAGRLIDQLLLRQEMDASRFPPADPAQVDGRLAELRREFGGEEAFRRLLAEYSLSEAGLRQHLELQLNILRFIDLRFHPMVVIEEPDIERYYRETLVPRLHSQGAKEIPPLDEVRDRIDAILTQERINQLYTQWLGELRSQARVQFR